MPSRPELDCHNPLPAPNTAPLRIKTVFLTGFMGSGKSSVGLALAHKLGWAFHDLDSDIEAGQRRSIGEIFQTDGELGFRRIERAVLADLLASSVSGPVVIALGGGTFAQRENHDLFTSTAAVVVFLDAPVEELWARCHEQPVARPLRQDPEHFRNLYEARREFYTRAEIHIQTGGKSVDAIAQEIAQRLRCDYEVKEKSR